MSAIPNLLKVGEIPSNLNMFVETSILDPVVQSDTFVRFNMKRAGFLHSNSKLALSLNKRTVANFGRDGDHTFLPVSVGVGSLISRVRLLSGNTVIQEIDDWGHLHAYNSLFISNENQKEREQFTTGRVINMSFDYDDGVNNRSDTKATGVALDPGSEYMDGSVNGAQYDPATTSWSKELQRYQYLDNEPVWQISLMDLCPFLKKTQLPLFMFEEQIFLEITYSDQQIRAVGNAVAVAAHNAIPANTDNNFAYTINQVETKLIIDYITYPQEIMDSWAKANKNLSFQYVDYELSKFTLDRNSASAGFIRNIGGIRLSM